MQRAGKEIKTGNDCIISGIVKRDIPCFGRKKGTALYYFRYWVRKANGVAPVVCRNNFEK